MSSVQVRILNSGRTDIYGLPLFPGSVITVDRDYAVSLVSTGFASWMDPTDAFDGATNIRKPSEIYTLHQSGIHWWIPAGDGGANGLSFTGTRGVFTLSAAVITNFWNLLAVGGYAYLPTGAGGLATGGWYWCVMTSDTAGEIFAETYSGIGKPQFVASPTALPNLSAGRITQVTTEVVCFSFVLPGGSMGPNGVLEALTSVCGDTSAANKTYRIRTVSGSVVMAQTGVSTSPVGDVLLISRNRGTQSAQIGPRSGSYAFGATIAGAWQYSQIDTSIDQTLQVSLQVSANTGSAMLSGLDVSVRYGA
jgi:hypothetical protein